VYSVVVYFSCSGNIKEHQVNTNASTQHTTTAPGYSLKYIAVTRSRVEKAFIATKPLDILVTHDFYWVNE
jgi:hypothetical protein